MGFNQDDISIVSANFGDPQWIEITYVDNDSLRPGSRVRKLPTIQVDPNLVRDDLDTVLSNLRDIVQAALIEDRQPPASYTAPR